MTRHPFRAALAALASLLALAGTPVIAAAQSLTGSFQPWQDPPQFAVSTNPNGPGGSFIVSVDDDNNIVTPPIEYNLSSQAPSLAGKDEYTVSPSRDALFVLEDNTAGTGPSRLWFADLDGAGGVTITHGPYSIQGSAPGARRLRGPHYFDVPGQTLRTAVMILGQPSGVPDLWAQVFDLNTPGLAGEARVNLADGLDGPPSEFAPSGTHLVIKNGLQDIDPDIDFTLISLCPDVFGQSTTIQLDPVRLATGGQPQWRVENVSMMMLDVAGQIPAEPMPFFVNTYNDCTDQVAGPTGACCVTVFGIPTCIDGVDAAICPPNATFFPNMLCADVCPSPAIALTNTGPASAVANTPYTYTLNIQSTGGVALINATAQAALPPSTTFVSATAGGQLAGNTVSWTLGDLNPGQNRAVSFTVTTSCAAANTTIQLSGFSTSANADNVLQISGNSVATAISSPAADPVDLTVTSLAELTEPVGQGDRIIHTIAVTNTSPATREVAIPGNGFIFPGPAAELDQLIDAGPGAFEASGNGGVRWTATLAPNQSTSFSLATRVTCVTAFSTESQLNGTQPIAARNACGVQLASELARTIPLRAPIETLASITNTSPGMIGPRKVINTFAGTENAQTVRPGATLDLRFELTNISGATLPAAELERVFPADFILAADPFLPPVPAGASFDQTSGTIRWTGPLADGETVELRVRAAIAADADCRLRAGFTGRAEAGSGCDNASAQLALFVVPEPPAGPHLVYSDFFVGLADYNPATQARRDVFCPINEFAADVALAADGTVFVAGLPGFYLNRATLDFDVLDGPGSVVGLDPDANAGLFANGSGDVTRYRTDGTREVIIADPALQISGLTGLPGGTVFTVASGELRRFETAGAPGPLALADSTPIATPDLDYSLDAVYGTKSPTAASAISTSDARPLLTLQTSYFTGAGGVTITALAELDPATDTVTVIDDAIGASVFNVPPLPASVGVLTNLPFFSAALARGENDTIWIGDGVSETVLRYQPSPRSVASVVLPYFEGLAFSGQPAPCNAADLAPPLGILDVDDLLAFLAAFSAGDPAADIAPPSGTFDIEDVQLFLTTFAAGCP